MANRQGDRKIVIHTRPSLTTLPPSIHGARNYKELAQLGLNPDHILDFSATSNPYGPHPIVLQAIQQAITSPTIARYPDRDNLALCQAIATAESVSPPQILPTNGASELIQLIALAFIAPQKPHLILAPTFGEYNRAIHMMGGNTLQYRPDNLALHFDIEPLLDTIQQVQPQSVWLCNPNNPTGQQWTPAELQQLYAAAPHALWVIDQSYRYFGHPPKNKIKKISSGYPAKGQEQTSIFNATNENVIIIRSLTKEHALAGLRLGYAIAAPKLIVTLKSVQPPWSVNTLAQIAGIAALQPQVLTWRDESLAQLQHHATKLWGALKELGYKVNSTSTPYALVNVKDGSTFRHTLLKHGLLVRDCTSFALPQYIRITTRLPPENKQLITAMRNQTLLTKQQQK